MKFYIACGLTESHDQEIVRAIVRYIEERGHIVLDEHVAHLDNRARFSENTGIRLAVMDLAEKETIIRDTDLAWVREADGFIGLYFSASEGASIEFEHRRLLLELQRKGLLREPLVHSRLFLCIFLRERKRSALLHGISLEERELIAQEYVDKKEEALEVVKRYVSALSERTP